MPRYSAKARRIKGRGSHSGPNFIQLFHYVKRSVEYHGLSLLARALLTELIDRYNGCNNGMIVLGIREAMYETGCKSMGNISAAFRELDDANLARPTKVGAWRGRQATEWRLTWKRCDKTGDLPRSNWRERRRFVQLLLEPPKREPLTNAERQKQWRDRKRNDDRNAEFPPRNAEVPPTEIRRYASSPHGTQNGNSSINVTKPSSTHGTHLHIYQTPQRESVKEGDGE
jgi:hypothetical protein